MTVSVTTGTGLSPSFNERYGVITRPSGILALFRSELEVGIALRVHRWYDGSAFANGDGEMHALGGRTMSGGGRRNSNGSGGAVNKFALNNRRPFCPPTFICPNWSANAPTPICACACGGWYTGPCPNPGALIYSGSACAVAPTAPPKYEGC